ncbi:MAG: hypothetical protein HZA10_04180 [Nitrospirae bacterium]|nr:hypothetical protein [Nitrospirota bacterium]
MKKWQKITIYIFIALPILVGVAIWGIDKLMGHMCGNNVIEEVLSPDQKLKVVIFQRDCGDKTGFSIQASLIYASNLLPNKSGNLFTSDIYYGRTPSGHGGSPKIQAIWQHNDTIVIKYHMDTKVFKAEKKLNGVNIIYETY